MLFHFITLTIASLWSLPGYILTLTFNSLNILLPDKYGGESMNGGENINSGENIPMAEGNNDANA